MRLKGPEDSPPGRLLPATPSSPASAFIQHRLNLIQGLLIWILFRVFLFRIVWILFRVYFLDFIQTLRGIHSGFESGFTKVLFFLWVCIGGLVGV